MQASFSKSDSLLPHLVPFPQADQSIGFGGWRTGYIIYISIIGGIALVMEPLTWYLHSKNRPSPEEQKAVEKASMVDDMPSAPV